MEQTNTMQADFWQARWSRNEIGFHLDEVNPYLRRHWPALRVEKGAQVLVPLCGKSLDIDWLAANGLRVIGVELAERAVQDFFAERGLEAQVEQRGAFSVHRHGDVELWCGDFFALSAEDVADCVAVYDRAALIALPPPMRRAYVEHLERILPSRCEGLLITLDYDQAQMSGPPFAVADAEVRQLYAGWQIDTLESLDVLGENWRFLQRGLTRLEENVYRLHR